MCDCSVDTLERRYADTIKSAKDRGRSSLRRHQWELAQKGNPTMLIWLGKQLLGQRDHRDMQVSGPAGLPISVNNPDNIKAAVEIGKLFLEYRDELKPK